MVPNSYSFLPLILSCAKSNPILIWPLDIILPLKCSKAQGNILAQLTYEGTLVGAYEQVTKCCRRVWQTVSDPDKPTGSFVKILQRPGEDSLDL